MSRLQKIAERRIALVERVAQQRSEIGRVYRQLERPASIFDKGVALARGVRSHPVVALTVGLAAMVYLRKHAASKHAVIGKLAGTAFTVLRIGLAVAKSASSRK
jgi:hypothetical protein